MRVDPATFDKVFQAFIGLILVFFAYAGIRMAMMESRRRNPKPPPKTKPQTPGEHREGADTFGTSGIGASDMSPAGFSSPGDFGSGDSSGSDSGGGGGDS